jgi:hypothetical protein
MAGYKYAETGEVVRAGRAYNVPLRPFPMDETIAAATSRLSMSPTPLVNMNTTIMSATSTTWTYYNLVSGHSILKDAKIRWIGGS